MKKTTEIHEALRQRRNIESEILDLNFRIEILNIALTNLNKQKTILDNKLKKWDEFQLKTKTNENKSIE